MKGLAPDLLIRRRLLAVFLLQASDDVSGPISGQDFRGIGLVAAFELLDLFGAAPLTDQRGSHDPPHGRRRAIGFEPQFIAHAVPIRRGAGDAGNSRRLQVSKLPACSSRQLHGRHWQAIDLRPVPGVEQHPVDLQFVQVILFPVAIVAGEGDDVAAVRGVVESDHKIGPALFVLVEGDGPARKIASRDFKRAALAGRQRQYIGVRLRWLVLIGDSDDGLRIPDTFQKPAAIGLGNRWSRQENNGEGLPAKAHRQARSKG